MQIFISVPFRIPHVQLMRGHARAQPILLARHPLVPAGWRGSRRHDPGLLVELPRLLVILDCVAHSLSLCCLLVLGCRLLLQVFLQEPHSVILKCIVQLLCCLLDICCRVLLQVFLQEPDIPMLLSTAFTRSCSDACSSFFVAFAVKCLSRSHAYPGHL